MSDRDELVKQLRKSEQKVGELAHKLKQRKEDKNNFNTQIGKMNKENKALRADLFRSHQNLEIMSEHVITLKRAFKIISMSSEYEARLMQIFAESKASAKEFKPKAEVTQ